MGILNNKTQIPIESELSDSDIVGPNHKNCSYCNQPFIEEVWCKTCDPYKIIEGWTSENPDIDKFIKDTMYARKYGTWLEWVPFDRFTNIEQIGEGGFSKVYSATWEDGKAEYKYEHGKWKRLNSKPIKVALKRLNSSHEMSIEYLNELKIHWDVYLEENFTLGFYGMTKDPVTKEFMMIIEFMNGGSLRSILLNEFNRILWSGKIRILGHITLWLNNLHKLGYFHKNLHSGNILIFNNRYYNGRNGYISDFGLIGPANKQKSNDMIYGILPYIAPEILNGKQYTSPSDIYSFALDICNGLRPEFGKGTPEIYKKLAYRCMNSNPKQRPKADELSKILIFWYHSINGEIFGYKGSEVEAIFEEADREVKTIFEKADREIPNITTSYGKNTSQIFSFSNLPNPSNSSIVNSYFEENMDNKDNSDKYEICSHCEKLITEELWCNKCDPHYMIDGWTSEFPDIDKFIKDTMYNARDYNYYFLEWVPFDRFTGIKQICEDELAKVYSAIWIDGKPEYEHGSWKKRKFKSMKIVLKSLNESQDISPKYLNELKFYWNTSKKGTIFKFYGITKNPKTKKIMMIIELTNLKRLRNILTNDLKNILWNDKICLLQNLAFYLKYLHELKYFYKDLHCGNVFQKYNYYWILDFKSFEQTNEQKLDDKIYGVLPYIAPEVLNGESYTFSSDIYSFGIIMAELSSGKTPFYNRSHNSNLASDICNGLRPVFGKGTPEIYKKLAYKCMNANSIERPTADELYQVVNFWNDILNGKILGYVGKEIKVMFEDADKEIPNTISTLYESNPDAKLTCQVFTFSNLPKPVNSSIITSYIDEIYNKEDNQIDNKICSYCNNPFTEKLWCKECDPYCIIEGWTSGNLNIDKFIKDSIYNARQRLNPEFLEWVPFDKLINIE
ncbi:kinase-like domain-containing protein [Rhizophagus irregularis DAOM 181602=DAOM 197198]|nr:kinase-like domain-containing protein [Rhizophagus irregularis DAOM 181602=DAOM 197198]